MDKWKGIPAESFDCYVVEQRGYYLVAVDEYRKIRISQYRWDAWRTRNIQDARMVAAKLGAEVRRFNPVTGVFG